MASEPAILSTKQLKLRDVVRIESRDSGPWQSTTVTAIRDGKVKFERPYMITSDFVMLGSVIGYIGLETYELPFDDSRPMWELLKREETPR